MIFIIIRFGDFVKIMLGSRYKLKKKSNLISILT
jgi:hypothetical protein